MKKASFLKQIEHSLLKRQLDSSFEENLEKMLKKFVGLVDRAYQESDKERHLIEHAMTVMSKELMSLNKNLLDQTKELKKSQERYSLAAKASNDGFWDWDMETGYIEYSPRWREILGLTHEDSLHTLSDWVERAHPDDRVNLRSALHNHLLGLSERVDIEYRIKTNTEKYIWVHTRGLAARDERGRALHISGSQTDITYRKEYEYCLYRAAFHDELTGLSNRSLFLERLDQTLQRLKRPGEKKAAVIFLDLDRFKYINDTMGHEMGDGVLKIVAQVLKNAVRPNDTVARLGGDEFTVLLEPIETLEEAKIISQRVLEHLNQPYTILGKDVHISSSVGLTLIDENITDPQSVLRNADLAMYQAKTTGKARLEVFDQYQHEKLIQKMQMESDIRQAFIKDEFLIYYQPVVDIETKHLFGFEALIRWNHQQLGFISPVEFIPLAEEIGLIGRIGEFVLRKAADQVGSWIDLVGFEKCPHISVNISVRQLLDFHCFENIVALLNSIGEHRRYLILEVTESVIIRDPSLIIARLEIIKNLGTRISIDDFGTGYSSLSYLHSFPFDFLKIDRAFIEGMIIDAKAERLVSTIIGMARDLGLKSVAVGVESQDQLERLKQLSCPYAQGYLFSPALDVVHATNFLVKYIPPQHQSQLLEHLGG